MSTTINNEINELKQIRALSNLTDDFLFGPMCYKFFYNEGVYTSLDHDDHFCDGTSDGGIDLVGSDESNDKKALVLIQAKNVQSNFDKNDILEAFNKMYRTYKHFQDGHTANYNQKLKRVFHHHHEDVKDDDNFYLKVVIFLNQSLADSYRNEFEALITGDETLSDVLCEIFYTKEIEEKIAASFDEEPYVEEASLKYFRDDGVLKNEINEDHEGIIINASANSLKTFYERFSDKGLFEQNFRYYVKQAAVDDKLDDSLKNQRQNFWHFNNGIIIGCEDYIQDGDNFKLYNFSIVNGCQTVSRIGKYSGNNQNEDFRIACKIIKGKIQDTSDNFIEKVAEYSNSQKAINVRDLKSNSREQKELRNLFKRNNPMIHFEVKRGEKAIISRNDLRENPWRKIKNELFGQLVLSVLLQKPGTARAKKKTIFSNQQVFTMCFRRERDMDLFVDMLKLNNHFGNFKSVVAELSDDNPTFTEPEDKTVVNNGFLFILSVIGYQIKVYRGLLDFAALTPDLISIMNQDKLRGKILNDHYDDFEKDMYFIFEEVALNLSSTFKECYNNNQVTSVTNLFKSDNNFNDKIMNGWIKNKRNRDRNNFEGTFKKVFNCNPQN